MGTDLRLVVTGAITDADIEAINAAIETALPGSAADGNVLKRAQLWGFLNEHRLMSDQQIEEAQADPDCGWRYTEHTVVNSFWRFDARSNEMWERHLTLIRAVLDGLPEGATLHYGPDTADTAGDVVTDDHLAHLRELGPAQQVPRG